MNFVNETSYDAGWTTGFLRDGREMILVVIKATFDFPSKPNGELRQSATQAPLTEEDIFTGEPGESATKLESDYAHFKPQCDVILHGCAYAPEGDDTTKLDVTMQIDSMKKSFTVYGDRCWEHGTGMERPSKPKPFKMIPMTYDYAYGGTDAHPSDPNKLKAYLDNPVGAGYYPNKAENDLIGLPIANTASLGNNSADTAGNCQPMALGPMGRNFKNRIQYAGTYDKHWLEHKAPFWPDDFDYRYFQCAPEDQRITFPTGGERVTLMNLSRPPLMNFVLPKLNTPVLVVPVNGKALAPIANVDTLIFNTYENQVEMVARVNIPLRRNAFEISSVVVGKSMAAHRKQLRFGTKTHYKNLDELIKDSRRDKD